MFSHDRLWITVGILMTSFPASPPSISDAIRRAALVHGEVGVVNYPDGQFAVQFNGRTLPFRMFDKIQTVQPGTIVDNKRLSAVLAMVKVRQAGYEPKRQRGHVARQRPPNNLEAPGLPSKGQASRADLAGPSHPTASG